MSAIIEIQNLKKQYGDVKAVDGISLTVEEGELFGFLGINGAGKSTTIRILTSILKMTEGTVRVAGYDLAEEPSKIRENIGVVWQENCLDDLLTVRENLELRGAIYGLKGQELTAAIHHVTKVLHLEDILDRRYKRMSGGQKRRCEIAAAILHAPRILFLDEPTTGLDPATRELVWKSIQQLQKDQGMTVFLTTHYMEEAARADHIGIMDQGHLMEFDTPVGLKERFAIDTLRLFARQGAQTELRRLLSEVSAKRDVPGDGGHSAAGEKLQTGEQKTGSVSKNNLHMNETAESIDIAVADSMTSLPIIEQARQYIRGFEVVQGTMDDVFLNVTGKRLVEA